MSSRFPPPLSLRRKKTSLRKTRLAEWVESLMWLLWDVPSRETHLTGKKDRYLFPAAPARTGSMCLPPGPAILSSLWPPRDKVESDVTQRASLWPVSTRASVHRDKGLLLAFHAAFDALGNRLWTRERREERKPVLGLKGWDTVSYEYWFFMLFMTILLSVKGQSFPLPCSSVIKAMVRKYLNEKLLIPIFFSLLIK